MLPAINIPTIKLFDFIPLQPFGILVGLAIVLGYLLGQRRAAKVGLDPNLTADGEVAITIGGFVVAHLVSVIFYFPERILDDPLQLVYFWAGLSSFGGLIGAAIATYIFFKREKTVIIKYVDAIVFGFVPAWILGRLGCTIVYDHPGLPTDFVLGMSNKAGMPRDYLGLYDGGQVLHNLGFYEFLLAIVLTIVIYGLKNVRPFDGFHPALMLILYSPLRFFFDTLRVQDRKYFGLTPGQYFAIGMFGVALVLIYRGLKYHRTPGGVDPRGKDPRGWYPGATEWRDASDDSIVRAPGVKAGKASKGKGK